MLGGWAEDTGVIPASGTRCEVDGGSVRFDSGGAGTAIFAHILTLLPWKRKRGGAGVACKARRLVIAPGAVGSACRLGDAVVVPDCTSCKKATKECPRLVVCLAWAGIGAGSVVMISLIGCVIILASVTGLPMGLYMETS